MSKKSKVTITNFETGETLSLSKHIKKVKEESVLVSLILAKKIVSKNILKEALGSGVLKEFILDNKRYVNKEELYKFLKKEETLKPIEIKKSTRHSKITGDFGEGIVLYLLSKYGFESANVDHTGIDIISKNETTGEVMGVSVKSRSKSDGAEGSYISIPNDNFDKVEKACNAFNCVPYFAIVSDEKEKMYVFILSMKHLLELFPKGEKISAWKMTDSWIEKYLKDKEIMSFEFSYKNHNWW